MACDVALIGFGEAASTFARAGRWEKAACAFDILPAQNAVMASLAVEQPGSAELALADAPLAISLVTADQALAAAQECARLLTPGAIWCDMNSVAPETKRAAGVAVEAAGGRYVDVAVLAPVDPAGLGVPLLLAGAAALEAQQRLAELGFSNIRIVGDEVGKASAIKMIRSVMVKGIEALTAEMMAGAEAAGVADEVLASLDASEKAISWRDKAAYNLERMTRHGLRRAAEMEEAVKTLRSLGVEPVMTERTVRRQRAMAVQGEGSR